MGKFQRIFVLFALVLCLTLTFSFPSIGRDATPTTPEEETEPLESVGAGIPVTLDGQELFLVRDGIDSLSPEERARAIMSRIEHIADDDTLALDKLTIKIDPDNNYPSIVLGDTAILTVTSQDAKLYKGNQLDLARAALEKIKTAIERYRVERQPEHLLQDGLYLAIATVVEFFLVAGVVFLSGRLFPAIERAIASLVPGIRFQGTELISPAQIGIFFRRLLQFFRLLLILVLVYFYLTFILRLFPWTKPFGDSFLNYFVQTTERIVEGFAGYLPNLFFIIAIGAVTYYTLTVIKPFFTAIEKRTLVINGFYADWARPTYNIVKFLTIALAAVIAFPYLPGFNSPAFQGASVFLGVLFSLGSTSAIANIVGGVILIYTRAFQIGDRISIKDITGEVIEKTLLVTRIRTATNKIVTLPNSLLLNTDLSNFSVSQRELNHPLLLQTKVTLRYEIPWRIVHETLLKAALATDHLLAEPEPFVLQISLDEFYVTYQLNAYTDRPNSTMPTYSGLHQNIQDQCKAIGITIVAPNYSSIVEDSSKNTDKYAAVGYINGAENS
jgi:small-conductance mechanosensitive channel